MKLCECGCNNVVPPVKYTSLKNNTTKGIPNRFINGHNRPPNYKGGRKICKGLRSYECTVYIKTPNHHRANTEGYVQEHVLVVEKALGKPILRKYPIHHVNKNRLCNAGKNLVVCEDAKYHKLLHARQASYDACGKIGWLKCKYCKQHDDPENLYVAPNKKAGFHRACQNAYARKRKRERRHNA